MAYREELSMMSWKKREALREEILAERRKVRRELEQERSSKVITMIHRREPWLEPDEERSIVIEDSEKVLMEIHRTPKEQPIDIILHTPGGLVLAAEMIASALKRHPARVTAIVPFYAMSGGTLIALAADEILMEEFSVLGPLDPQIHGLASGSLLGLLEKKPIESISDDIVILADLAGKSIREVKSFLKWLLEDKPMPEEDRELLAEFLTGGYVAHDKPLMFEMMLTYGIPLKSGVPGLVFELFETCAFGGQRPQLASYLW
jgi:ClpP class serine protease